MGVSLVLRGAGALARTSIAKKLLKKTVGRLFRTGAKVGGAIAGGVAIDRAIGGMGGGGGIKFPTSISPFGGKGGGILQHPFGGGAGRGRIDAGEMGACPQGYHLNKRPLHDGTAARTVCVRNRSVNYANGKAARRAGRRLKGTVKMLKRSFSLVSGHPAKGKFIPRKG